MNKTKIITTVGSVALTVLIGVALASAGTWTSPTGTPPNNNTETPINEGSTLQIKRGDLTINGALSALNGLTLGSGKSVTLDGGKLNLTNNSQVCLGSDCITKWPDLATYLPATGAGTPGPAGAPGTPAPVVPTGPVVNGTCGVLNGKLAATKPGSSTNNTFNDPLSLCSSGTYSTVSESPTSWSWICNGSGGGTSAICSTNRTNSSDWHTIGKYETPLVTETIKVISGSQTIQQYPDIIGWQTFTANAIPNGFTSNIRVRGDVDDGGYCAATWTGTVPHGTAKMGVSIWRHEADMGYYSRNGAWYDGIPVDQCTSWEPVTESVVSYDGGTFLRTDSGDIPWAPKCLAYGAGVCPAAASLDLADGMMNICQKDWDAGPLIDRGTASKAAVIRPDSVIKLTAGVIGGPKRDHINCYVDVQYQ